MHLDGIELWHSARLRPATVWRYRPWCAGHVDALRRHRGNGAAPAADDVYLAAAAAWLARAQDVGRDGGVVGRYRLDRGWTSSYPETTGYIVPTFITLGAQLDPAYFDRAARCVRFLHDIQLPHGGFPAGEIAENRATPSPFNTAQVIHGLLAWHRYSGDPESLKAARRAGEWLISVQDEDGAWRTWFYRGIPACYSAHLSCWLADLGVAADDERFLSAASRHVDWVMAQRSAATGWFDRTAFTEAEQAQRLANSHTIAYTLAGLLHSAAVLRRDEVREAVIVAADRLAGTVARLGWLPGVLDWKWRARADSACLTGNAQMALIWMELYWQTRDGAWLAPAYAALDVVKGAQLLDSPNPDLRGGIPGSTPIWGSYHDGRILNWAAKFFIDALQRKALIEKDGRP